MFNPNLFMFIKSASFLHASLERNKTLSTSASRRTRDRIICCVQDIGAKVNKEQENVASQIYLLHMTDQNKHDFIFHS